jgi:Tfp pilus assembly protein PilF
MRMRIAGYAMLVSLSAAGAGAATGKTDHLEAIRLNDRGVALMSQQLPERAARNFAAALQKDPEFAQAAVNEGIALYAQQKLEDAEAALQRAIRIDPKSAQAWYNLGLTQRSLDELSKAAASFRRAAALDPHDADSFYFEGACYAGMGEFSAAIPIFQKALAINPLHPSAEFGLARSLVRTGHKTEAQQDFKRFQMLTNDKLGTPIGQGYGEQGRYSTVTAVQEPETIERKMIPVRLAARPMIPENAPSAWTTGGGACMIDATGSGQMDLVLMQSGSQAIRILHPQSDGALVQLDAPAMGLSAGGQAVACAVGDYDGDKRNDLAVAMSNRVLLFRNLGHGRFQDVTAHAGLMPRNRPTGISFIDYDHDGNLDLFLTGSPLQPGGESNVVWRNDGDGAFTEQTQQTGLGGSGKTSAAMLTDFNNDRAVDIAVTGAAAAPILYINPRTGKWPTQPLYDRKSLPPTAGIAVLDYNKDGWMDVAVTHAGPPGLTLWRNVAAPNPLARRFEQVRLPLQGALRGWGVTPIDIDNDGWIDLAAIVDTKAGPQVHVFRNRGDGTFEDVSAALGLDKVQLKAPRGLIAADLENKGAADLIVTQRNAPPVWLRNVGANKNHFVRLALVGNADNKTGIGAKVEVFANGLWQKWELTGASGYQTQGPPQILIGLGKSEGISLLRILWPTGVLQDEMNLPHTETITEDEVDRRGSSCPVLFVWNGNNYQFVTDVLGAGVVGHWFTPARHNIPRPSEWVKVDGEDVAPVNGKVSVRFMEPMEEVNYVDQLRLVAVDHPKNVRVNPDERFLDSPPFASGQVVASVDARPPAGAWDGTGRDVLDELLRRDHRFAGGFTPLPYDGFANLHALTLDLGRIDTQGPLRLLMTGYVNYFSATSLYAAWQAGVRPIDPYIEAQLPDGEWRRIDARAGFPAGLERTIVVNLTGKLPPGTRRIRLMTNLEIYWDQVLIDRHAQGGFRATELPLELATEQFQGYPKEIDGPSPGDLSYNYNLASLTGPFQHEAGDYTHFGDVTPLLKSIDDRFAIFGSGEGIAAEFDASRLPSLPPGWKRDYFFYANGYEKDMDWWDSSPFTVSPLPFHEMTSYPYSIEEGFPASAASLRYRLNWNDRYVSGKPTGLHRFQYQWLPSAPSDDPAKDARERAPDHVGSE